MIHEYYVEVDEETMGGCDYIRLEMRYHVWICKYGYFEIYFQEIEILWF
jgi:hypothetical protein